MVGLRKMLRLTSWAIKISHSMSSLHSSRLARSTRSSFHSSRKQNLMPLTSKRFWSNSLSLVNLSVFRRNGLNRMLRKETSIKSQTFLLKSHDLTTNLPRLERNSSKGLKQAAIHLIQGSSYIEFWKKRRKILNFCLINLTNTERVESKRLKLPIKTLKW